MSVTVAVMHTPGPDEVLELRVEVTAEHIAEGAAGSSCNCPVALAVRDACAAAGIDVLVPWSVVVMPLTGCIWTADRRRFLGDLPDDAREFIKAFDDLGARGVDPFSFAFRLVQVGDGEER